MKDANVRTSPKSIRRAGWALLAIALATPAIISAAGAISVVRAGELTSYVGLAWLAAAIVIDLLTLKREAVTRAIGRILAAVFAVIFASTSVFLDYRDTRKVDKAKKEMIEQFMVSATEVNSASAVGASVPPATPLDHAAPVPQSVATMSQADRAVATMNAMKSRVKQFADESRALARKFNEIDLGTILVAQNLVTKAGIESSRQKLVIYKAAIAERNAALKNHMALCEQIIRNSGMSDREINEGLTTLKSGNDPVARNYADLTRAQLASVRATEEILNFAQRGLGRISVKNDLPLFQTQPELDEYRRLYQVAMEAAVAEDAIVKIVQAQAQKSIQVVSDVNKQLPP